MDKNELLTPLKDPNTLTAESVEGLKSLSKEYPYFQIPYFLIARYEYHSFDLDRETSLQKSSAYSIDRKILKKFVTDPLPRVEKAAEQNYVIAPPIETVVEAAQPVQETYQRAPQEEIAEVKEEEKRIELVEQVSYSPSDKQEQIADIVEVREESLVETPVETKEETVEELNAPVEESIEKEPESKNYFTEALANEAEVENKRVSEEKTAVSPSLQSDSEDSYFNEDEIEEAYGLDYLTTLKEVTEEKPNYRRKIQDELIDRFIQSRPSLARPTVKPHPEEQEDLAEKNLVEDSNLVSENLAIIMVKQGKIEKAIDIYKKLIWKYPQKKAYFANRIEELKK